MKKNKAADKSKLELFAENTPEAISSDIPKIEPLPAYSPDDTAEVLQDEPLHEEVCQTIPDEIQAEPVPINASGDVTVSRKVRFDGRKNKKKLTRNVLTYRISMTIFFVIACMIAVVSLLPIVLTILNSFMSETEIKTNYSAVFNSLSGYTSSTKTYLASEPKLKLIPEMVSFKQYEKILFDSPTYLIKFWNSVTLVVPIVIFQMIAGALAAYSFARYRKKRREVLFFSYIILMLMPFQVTLVPNYLIADKLGILDKPLAIILPGIFSTFSVFLLTKYMRQIPSSYIEAAKLDGAGEWQIFTMICIPMCRSALYAMGILLFIDYWNMVEQPLVLLTDPDKQPLSVFLSQINSGEVGIAFAASFIFMIPPLLIFLHGEQYLIEGISRSGIK